MRTYSVYIESQNKKNRNPQMFIVNAENEPTAERLAIIAYGEESVYPALTYQITEIEKDVGGAIMRFFLKGN